MEQNIGGIISELYEIWKVNHKYWPSSKDKSHLEFELMNFDPTSERQIELVSELCILVKSGEWQMNYEVLRSLFPDQDLDIDLAEEIKIYFSGAGYSSAEYDEYIQTQRNPFILELLSHVMLLSIENHEACNPYKLILQGIHYMHLSSKKQGLDLAAIAQESNGEYYLIIGESKNRKVPSDGTKEALEAFRSFDSGQKWPDIRQVMKAVANSFENPNDRLSAKISKHILWEKKIIYRLTIEHRSLKPKDGSQFRDFKSSTPNVGSEIFRQCEAISTKRLDDFYDDVSNKVLEIIENRGSFSNV
ncbi:hypothetical protein ACQQ6W_11045 [Lysinibacillus fusiformis]